MIFWGLRAKTVSISDLWLLWRGHDVKHANTATKSGTNMVFPLKTAGKEPF